MNKNQAINILSQVAAKFIGTRAEHEIIEQALKFLSELAEKEKHDAPAN